MLWRGVARRDSCRSPFYAGPSQLIASAGLPDAGIGEKAAATDPKRSRGSAVGTMRKTIRLRDKEHRKFVLRQPCLVCGRVPSDPHHLTFTQPRAMGRRRRQRVHRSDLPSSPPGASSLGQRGPHGGASSTLTRFRSPSSFGSRAERMVNCSHRVERSGTHSLRTRPIHQLTIDLA